MLILKIIPLFSWLIIFIFYTGVEKMDENIIKISALIVTVLALSSFIIVWFLFDKSCKYFQFVKKKYAIDDSNFYLGLDSFSVYFILLITLTNIGESLYNELLSNTVLITNTLYFVLLIILIPVICFLYFFFLKNLDEDSETSFSLIVSWLTLYYCNYLIHGIEVIYLTSYFLIFFAGFIIGLNYIPDFMTIKFIPWLSHICPPFGIWINNLYWDSEKEIYLHIPREYHSYHPRSSDILEKQINPHIPRKSSKGWEDLRWLV